jgi:hypothetical protein
VENIARLVENSLARHGVTSRLDHLRLQWSSWFRFESSFSVLLVPAKPGLFALGEEIVPPADDAQASSAGRERPARKRMLALFQVSQTDDLGIALGRLFLPGSTVHDRLASGHCFARYAVIEDPGERAVAYEIFQRWMLESAESASGISSGPAATANSARELDPQAQVSEVQPSSSFAWGMDLHDREVIEQIRRPAALPSGF